MVGAVEASELASSFELNRTRIHRACVGPVERVCSCSESTGALLQQARSSVCHCAFALSVAAAGFGASLSEAGRQVGARGGERA